MKKNTAFVSLKDIDKDDKTFLITTEVDTGDLEKSIVSVGLIAPPVLLENGERYIIVSGFRRINTLLKLDLKKVEAIILPKDTDRGLCAKIAISANSFQRPLNPIEISRGLCLLNEFYQGSTFLQAASQTGLPDNASLIKKLMPLSFFPNLTQKGILSGYIPVSMALELSRFPKEEGKIFTDLFLKIKMSLGKQREIIRHAGEIALREDISITRLFNDNDLKDIVEDEDIDSNLKLRRLREYLKRRRYPSIVKAEKRFEKYLKELKLENGIILTPPPYFESNIYSLSLRFKSLKELESGIQNLNKLACHSAVKKILDQNFS